MKAEYVDHMGDDLSVVNAARVSFDKESEWVCGCGDTNLVHDYDYDFYCGNCNRSDPVLSDVDTRLIHYLAKHNHWSPFAHTAITLRMSAPVPIRTQCFKHKVGLSENEESRRYIKSWPEVYYPDEWRQAASSVKQGSAGRHPSSVYWDYRYRFATGYVVRVYMEMIDANVCPEQARLILPQGCMVNWIWTGNLASYARFYNQRTDLHAQREIQDLARMVADIIKPLYPVSWAALTGGTK